MDEKKNRQPPAPGLDYAVPADDLPEIPAMDTIIGYMLRRAQLSVFQRFLECFAELDLRPAEFSVLSLVATSPGMKQSELAASLAIKPANMVLLIDRLQSRGLVVRRQGQSDRRSHSLHLTPAGADMVARMVPMWQAQEADLIERLGGKAEADHLIRLLGRLQVS